jgi:hypothetical protein
LLASAQTRPALFTARQIAKAFVMKVWRPRPERFPDVLVVSPGGVGTTFLMEHLARFADVNDPHDQDRLKHLPGPPPGLAGSRTRVIFVTGQPATIAGSLRRRGWLRQQSAKLGSVGGIVLTGAEAERAFLKAVAEQKRRWTQAGVEHLMMIEYEDIWDRVGDLANFLSISDPAFTAEFPARKERETRKLEPSMSQDGH